MSELVKIDAEITNSFAFDIEKTQAMVREYQTLTLIPDDKGSYDLCQKALTSCVRTRTGINKRRLELNKEDQNRIKKRNSAAKQLEAIVAPAEEHLTGLINAEKARLQAIEDEKREAEKRMIDDRIKQLGEYWVILPYQDVAIMTEEEFDTALFDAKEEWEEQERKRIEAEAAREAEEERLEKQREEQEVEAARLAKIKAEQEAVQAAREAEIKAKEEKIRKEQKAIQDEKDRIAKEETEKKEAEAAKVKADQEKADKEAQKAKEAEEKALRDAEAEKKRQAMIPDIQKLRSWILEFSIPDMPELSKIEVKEIGRVCVEYIEAALGNALKEVEDL